MKKPIRIQFASWTFDAEETESGDLALTVIHPVNGEIYSIDIAVDRQLGVVHNSHWTADERLQEEGSIMEWAVATALAGGADSIRGALTLARKDATAAQHLLRGLQGYEYEARVPFGHLPYWRRNGIECDAPGPVHHALAYAIVRETLEALDETL